MARIKLDLNQIRKNTNLVFGLLFLLIIALFSSIYFVSQNNRLKKQISNLETRQIEESKMILSPFPQINPNISGWRWKEYINSQIGFKITIPESINGIDFTDKLKGCSGGDGPKPISQIIFIPDIDQDTVSKYCPSDLPIRFNPSFYITVYDSINQEDLVGLGNGVDDIITNYSIGGIKGSRRIQRVFPPYLIPYSYSAYFVKKNDLLYSIWFSSNYSPEVYGPWTSKIIDSFRFLD